MNSGTFLRLRPCSWICVLALTSWAAPVPAAAPEEPEPWVDRELFPEGYSILTSERVMFPDNVSDMPVKIDSHRQLFVDDYLIASMENLSRRFHQPVKHPENPLMGGGSVGVLYDEGSGQFRMWSGTRYFTSTDGVHWKAPDLGPNGNMVFEKRGDLRGFMYNPDLHEQEGRYKVVLERRKNEEENEPGGFYLYHSRDGLHWTSNPTRPILKRTISAMNPGPFWAKGFGDTSAFRYDSVLKRYICDGKLSLYFPEEKMKRLGLVSDDKPRLKLRTFSESDDLIHWSPPRFMMYPDQLDPPDRQIYAHVGFVYESMWIGIIQAMRVQVTGWKQVDLRLSYSRDGRHWSRPRQRQPFIPLGGPDSWDPDYSGTSFTGPVLVGDKLYFYYFGSRNSERDKTGKEYWPTYCGLAILRQDGFASLNAGRDVGRITTRPMTFAGTKLFVNADVEEGGWVKAALLSRDSEPIGEYTLDDAVPMMKDTTKGAMGWRARKELVPPGDEHVRLVFQLKDANLYSFWIE